MKDLNAFIWRFNTFCKAFEEHNDIENYQKIKYILVDEFQDTNLYNKWLNLLVNESQNICCVGDDQSFIVGEGLKLKIF